MAPLHDDAYRLITYRADAGTGERELVWNSRDRAAPTTILLRTGGTAHRANTHEPYLPNHIPQVGDLVLVDCTMDWAVARAEDLSVRMWSAGENCGLDSHEALEASILTMFMHDVVAHFGVAVEVTREIASRHRWRIPA